MRKTVDTVVGRYHFAHVIQDICAAFQAYRTDCLGKILSYNESELPSECDAEFASDCWLTMPIYMRAGGHPRISTQDFQDDPSSHQCGIVCVRESDIREYFELSEDAVIDRMSVVRTLLFEIVQLADSLEDMYTYSIYQFNYQEDGDGMPIELEFSQELMDLACACGNATAKINELDKEYDNENFPLLVATGTLD